MDRVQNRKAPKSKPVGPEPPRASYRDRMRAQGMRAIQIWVPDTRAPSFQSEAHRQSAAVAAGVESEEDQAFIEAVSDRGDE